MPPLPLPEIPLILRLRRITTSLGPAWTTMPLVPATKTEATCPPPPSMVMALVMVTAPYPAGSRASISPPAAVLEIAPAKVLQGAVRLQGLASSPTPETHVRLAWPYIIPAPSTVKISNFTALIFIFILSPFNYSLSCFQAFPNCRHACAPDCATVVQSVVAHTGKPYQSSWSENPPVWGWP